MRKIGLLMPALLLAASNVSAEPNSLRRIMTDLGTEMSRAGEAILKGDHVTLASTARAIAKHPPVTQAQRMRIAKGLGPDMPRFKAADMAVHDAAMALAKEAEAGNTNALVPGYARVMEGCMQCHQPFRNRVRELLAD